MSGKVTESIQRKIQIVQIKREGASLIFCCLSTHVKSHGPGAFGAGMAGDAAAQKFQGRFMVGKQQIDFPGAFSELQGLYHGAIAQPEIIAVKIHIRVYAQFFGEKQVA